MIMDKKNLFSNAQAVTATALSTDKIDLGPPGAGNLGRNLGVSDEVMLSITAAEAALAAGAATVEFQLVTDDNPTLSSPTVVWSSGAIGKAALTLGARIDAAVPRANLERYLGINYVVSTGPLTAGKFTAGLVMEPGSFKAYGSAVTTGVN